MRSQVHNERREWRERNLRSGAKKSLETMGPTVAITTHELQAEGAIIFTHQSFWNTRRWWCRRSAAMGDD
jgi:hypothetical protein